MTITCYQFRFRFDAIHSAIFPLQVSLQFDIGVLTAIFDDKQQYINISMQGQ